MNIRRTRKNKDGSMALRDLSIAITMVNTTIMTACHTVIANHQELVFT